MLNLIDGRTELWQWDTGRKLSVSADCTQVHFSNKLLGSSIDVKVIDGTADIPDILLQVDKDLTAWAYVGTAENGYTKISKTFRVNRRNKPSDYVYTPPDQTTLQQILERLETIEDSYDPESVGDAVEEYLTNNPIQETDPTVPAWAKKPTKPAYNAAEVGAIPVPATAEVGQTIRVSAVDDSGKPTAWEAVDFPEGGGGASGDYVPENYRLIADVTLSETVSGDLTIEEDTDGEPFELTDVYVYVSSVLAEESTVEYSGSTVSIKACDVNGYTSTYHGVCFVGSSLKSTPVPFAVRVKHLDGVKKDVSIIPNGTSEGTPLKTSTIYFCESYKSWIAIPNGKIRGVKLSAFNPTAAFYGSGTRVTIIGR